LTRVLLLNRFFYPDHSATSQLTTDLATDLAARGFFVTVIASRQLYDNPSASLARIEMYSGVSMRRVATTRFGRGRLLGRAIDYLTFYLSASVAMWREVRRGAVIIVMTDPPLLSIPALIVARLRGAYCVNWMQDIFPEVAERLNLLRPRALAWFLRLLRTWSLRHTEVSVVIGVRMAKYVAPFCRAPPIVIPNWALEECTEFELQRNFSNATGLHPLRTSWGLGGAFVVGYSGNMGRAHRLDELIDAAAALRSRQDIRFLLIGDGAQRGALQARAQSLALENVLFRSYQPRDRLRESLTLPDIHVVTLDERLEGLIVPSKFVGVLALGRPVLWIGASDGELGCLVREFGCGVTVSPGNVAELTRVLLELSEDRTRGGARLQTMALAAHALWDRRFRRSDALNAWATIIKKWAR
jgi:glycosyltransferase involved in cell wall biosynthesis